MGQRHGFKHEPLDRVLRITGGFKQVADVLLTDVGVGVLKNLIQRKGEIACGNKILDAFGSGGDDGLLGEDWSLRLSRLRFVGFRRIGCVASGLGRRRRAGRSSSHATAEVVAQIVDPVVFLLESGSFHRNPFRGRR